MFLFLLPVLMPPPPLPTLEHRYPLLLTAFPRAMLDKRWSGEVGVALEVGTTGRVVTCKVTRSSGHRALDVRTCQTFNAKAHFKPATDEVGNPVKADVVGLIDWQLRK